VFPISVPTLISETQLDDKLSGVIGAARTDFRYIRTLLSAACRIVWLNSNDVGHINKVKLRRSRLVLGLVITFGRSAIPVVPRPLRPTQLGHPSVGRCNEYRKWFRSPLRKKRRVQRRSGHCDQDQDYWHILAEVGYMRLVVNLSSPSGQHGLYSS